MNLLVAAISLGLALGASAVSCGVAGAWCVEAFAVSVAIGLLLIFRREDESTRRRALPERECLALASTSALALLGLIQASWLGVSVFPLGVAAGAVLAHLLLFAGVQKTDRLRLVSGSVTGFAVGAMVTRNAQPVLAVALIVVSAIVVWVASRSRAAVHIDMAPPIPEPWSVGIPTSLAMAALGVALGVAKPGVGPQDGWVAAALLVIAAWASPWRQPTLRRAALLIGFQTLLGVTVVGAAQWLRSRESAPWIDWITLAPYALAGWAAPALARLYAEVPLGSNILSDIPPEERRAPDGGLLRLALLLTGAALGHAMRPVLTDPRQPFVLAFAAGSALILFDPRAGPGRKAMALGAAGVPAAVAGFALL